MSDFLMKESLILNTSLPKVHEDDKPEILDIRVLTNNLIEINIEIQKEKLPRWADRSSSMFYIAKMYAEQIKKEEPYDVLKSRENILPLYNQAKEQTSI